MSNTTAAALAALTGEELDALEVSTWKASHDLFMEVSVGATVVAPAADRRRVARLEKIWTNVLDEFERRGRLVDASRKYAAA